MPPKTDQELTKLDFYEILELSCDAGESDIKRAYRKKALKCHPDKNPDNPDAAKEFDRLKKILEILLDPGARKAYDKVLKARKAAKIRAREADAKTQRLKFDLLERERRAQGQEHISEGEKLRRELKRLHEEGNRIIQEEIEKLHREVRQEVFESTGVRLPVIPVKVRKIGDEMGYKVKVTWTVSPDSPGYTEKEIRQLFYKWGDILAMVVKQKTKRGTALIEYKMKSGAEMAVNFEKGHQGRPLKVERIEPEEEKVEKESKAKPQEQQQQSSSYDFESVADMNRRRREERQRLIEQIKMEDSLK